MISFYKVIQLRRVDGRITVQKWDEFILKNFVRPYQNIECCKERINLSIDRLQLIYTHLYIPNLHDYISDMEIINVISQSCVIVTDSLNDVRIKERKETE